MKSLEQMSPGELQSIDMSAPGCPLTKQQAATWLQCSERTVERRIRDGRLYALHDEGMTYIPRSALVAYLEGLKSENG